MKSESYRMLSGQPDNRSGNRPDNKADSETGNEDERLGHGSDVMKENCASDNMTGHDRRGKLYIVATPIGNLDDITLRALRVLNEVDLIAAEDTRHTARLLSHFQIKTPVISCHEHNEASRIELIVSRLSDGSDVALVSDAGTPLISDPGYIIVREIAGSGFDVIPIPGVCAAIAGLSVSGLPTERFIFAGFQERKKGKRSRDLQALAENTKGRSATLIFYESPHRITGLIEDIIAVMGDREAMIAREMTKFYEEYLRGSLSSILSELQSRELIKGEFVLYVNSESSLTSADIDNEIDSSAISVKIESDITEALQSSNIKISTLAKELSKKYNLPRQEIYGRILDIRDSESTGP